MSQSIPHKTITTLKKEATALKKREGITHAEALERIAKGEGFKSWGLLQLAIDRNRITSHKELLNSIISSSLILLESKDRRAGLSCSIKVLLEAISTFEILILVRDGTESEVARLILEIVANVKLERMGDFDEGDFRRVGEGITSLSKIPLFISSGQLNVEFVEGEITKCKGKKFLTVIDVVEWSRDEISRLKTISKDCSVPILLIAKDSSNKRFVELSLKLKGEQLSSGMEVVVNAHRNMQHSVIKI